MKNLTFLHLWILLMISCFARDPNWYGERMKDIDAVERSDDKGVKIEGLAKYLGIGGGVGLDSEQEAIFKRAQMDLLAIPGHALYYQEKVEFMKEAVAAGEKRGHYEEGDVERADYENYKTAVFPILSHLPSPETVQVLAHFLNDSEGADRNNTTPPTEEARSEGDIDGPTKRRINSVDAAGALDFLGIETPPVQQRLGGENKWNQVDAWKDWWNEVKSGKRTYRFKGSPIEYGPDGPVSPKELSRREHDRPTVAATGSKTGSSSAGAEPLRVMAANSIWSKVAVALAVLLAMIGCWFAFGRRKPELH